MFSFSAVVNVVVLYIVVKAGRSKSTEEHAQDAFTPNDQMPDSSPQANLLSPQNCSFKASGTRRGAAGNWESPLTASQVASSAQDAFESPIIDKITGNVFWSELNDDGINRIYQYNPETGAILKWTSEDFNVGNRVNGLGGGSFLVHNDTLFFSNLGDNLLYYQKGSEGTPIPLTMDSSKAYADGCFSPEFNILFYVMEEMAAEEQFIVALNVTSLEESKLPLIGDFFASPVLSPDNTKLAWIQWDFPNSAWDETKLPVTALEPGRNFGFVKYLLHGSMLMPRWNQYNELLYVHDATNWWNLYINNKRNFEVNLTPFSMDAARPFWKFGDASFDTDPSIGSHEVIVAAGTKLFKVNTMNGESKTIQTPFSSLYGPKYSNDGKKVYLMAGNATERVTLVELNLESEATRVLLPRPSELPVQEVSQCRFLDFPTADGEQAFGCFYEPKNSKSANVEGGSSPPLILNISPMPVRGIRTDLNLEWQFFTSRGFAVFDLAGRGNAGRGREYLQKLYENFGKTDVEDIISAAEFLARTEKICAARMLLRGKGLSGFSALTGLASSHLFRAGTIYGGASNLTKLVEESPRFLKGYLSRLHPPLIPETDNTTDTITGNTTNDATDNTTSNTTDITSNNATDTSTENTTDNNPDSSQNRATEADSSTNSATNPDDTTTTTSTIQADNTNNNTTNNTSTNTYNYVIDPAFPLTNAKNMSAPLLLFHGTYDQYIHPNHTIWMHETLLQAGLPATLVLKEDGNEFSRASKAESLEEELEFYLKILFPEESQDGR